MTARFALALALFCTVAAPVFAEREPDEEGCKDSPLVQRFPGARLFACDDKEFDQINLDVGVGADKDLVNKQLEGRVQGWRYTVDEKKTGIQIARNFEAALKKSGARIVVGAGDSANPWEVTALFEKEKVYVNISTGGGDYTQTVVTVKAMVQEVEASSGAMLDELTRSGHVAIYGINFDTGKATLTEDSGKVLEQVQKLLTDNADLKLRIEGHTDEDGKVKDNLALSKKRAAAVKDWLVKNGVEAKRLTTEGYGSSKPVGDNKTDEGKAKNRRVELIKI